MEATSLQDPATFGSADSEPDPRPAPPRPAFRKTWWERRPGRLESELAWLRYHGIKARLDPDRMAAGRIVMHVEVVVDGRTHRLTVRYPDAYPYVRFEVLAPDLDWSRTQGPFNRNLCLVDRSLGWSMRDTLAKFLLEQLPRLLASAEGRDGPQGRHAA